MKAYHLLVIISLTIGVFLHVVYFNSISNKLNHDETAFGYNAYSILKTGKDEHDVSYSLYFKSFYDYKLPVYSYTSVIPNSFLGLMPIAVRLFLQISGLSALALIYFVSNRLFGKKIAQYSI